MVTERGLLCACVIAGILVCGSAYVTHRSLHPLIKRDRDFSKPRCQTDNSFLSTLEDGKIDIERIACDCNYVGSKDGQVGSNYFYYWYENTTCTPANFAYVMLTQNSRRAWEITCDCRETPENFTTCMSSENQSEQWLRERFSYLEDQWTRCTFMAPPAGSSYVVDGCAKMTYSDGTVVKGQIDCSIAGNFYWG